MSLENIRKENIVNGIRKSFNNADSLLDEAYILKSAKKWARAYTLSQLAIEELAKVSMLFNLLIDRINGYQIDYKQMNYNFNHHSEKTKISIESEIAFFKIYKSHSGEEWVDNAIKQDEELLTKVDELNNYKNESLYVSTTENDFKSPLEIITEEMFGNIFGTALLRKTMFENLVKASESNIEEIARFIKNTNSDLQ